MPGTSDKSGGRIRGCPAVVLGVCLSALCGDISAQYTGIALYPLTPPGGGAAGAFVAGGEAVGSYAVPFGDGDVSHALLWKADGTAVDLNPAGRALSDADATDGTQQVGYGTPEITAGFHALLWSGSPGSVIDLHPAGLSGIDQSVAYGLSATQQVGQGYSNLGSPNPIGHALLWNGSAASVVDLNPTSLPGITSSLASATDGAHEVGWSSPGTQAHHALMWSGSAASAVDLNPGGFATSMAFGVGGNQQVGMGLTASGGGGALLWTGSAASAVQLGGDMAVATNGGQQVGSSALRATVWSGTAASAIDLNNFLPAALRSVQSIATSIDSAGDIFGVAGGYAAEWLPHPVLPGDANLDGKVDFNDLIALGRHYGQTAGWAQGDFDQDGKTDFNDLVILARHYGQTLTGSQLGSLDPAFRTDVQEAFAQMPEPTALPIIALAALLPLRRRR